MQKWGGGNLEASVHFLLFKSSKVGNTMKKRQGFTLIELLAVIVILAVLALIATPIIMGVIEKAKIGSFKDSVYGMIKSGELYYSQNLLKQEPVVGETLDLVTTDKLAYKGTKPKSGKMNIAQNGTISIKASDGNRCYYKSYTATEVTVVDGSCDLLYDYDGDYAIPTRKDCFVTSDDGTVITDYLCYPGNNKNMPEIAEVAIPSMIQDGVKVTEIQGIANYKTAAAFGGKKLTKIYIPQTILKIGECAFNDNLVADQDNPFIYERSDTNHDGIAEINKTNIIGYAGKNKNVVIPNNIQSIGVGVGRAFAHCHLQSISIPDSVTDISSGSFQSNNIQKILHLPSHFKAGNFLFINNDLPDSSAFIYGRKVDGSEDRTVLNSYGGLNRETVVIPEGIKKIAYYAITNVKDVKFPTTLETIMNNSIISPATTIELPRSVTTITAGGLAGYSKVTKIINQTGRAFDWSAAFGLGSSTPSVTGSVVVNGRTVEIVTE